MSYRILILISLIVMAVQSHAQTFQADTLTDRVTAVTTFADTVIRSQKHRLDSAAKRVAHKIDSLKGKGQPTIKYQKKLDSINQRIQNLANLNALEQKATKPLTRAQDSLRKKMNSGTAKANSKIAQVRDSANRKLTRAERKAQRKIREAAKPLDTLSAKIKEATGKTLPGSNSITQEITVEAAKAKLPGTASIPGATLPINTNITTGQIGQPLTKNPIASQTSEISQAESSISKAESIPGREMSQLKNAKELNEIKTGAKEANQLEKQAGGYQKEISGLKKMDRDSLTKTADKDMQQAASNTAYAKDLKTGQQSITTQKNEIEQYKDMVEKMNAGNALKEGQAVVGKEMSGRFAGQEAKLQSGIAQLDKLKKKYHNIPDSRYLPRHAPNEMKGKPLKERLVPGLSLQSYQGSTASGFDISPYLMYRLTGRLRTGIGGSWRVATEGKSPYATDGKVQALRIMADYRALGTAYLHAEWEWTHYSGTQNIFRPATDPPGKDWTKRLNAGLLKTYKISRRLDGQAQLLYNVTDWRDFPQNKNTSVRFGVEYKMGVKKMKFGPNHGNP